MNTSTPSLGSRVAEELPVEKRNPRMEKVVKFVERRNGRDWRDEECKWNIDTPRQRKMSREKRGRRGTPTKALNTRSALSLLSFNALPPYKLGGPPVHEHRRYHF